MEKKFRVRRSLEGRRRRMPRGRISNLEGRRRRIP